MEDDLSEFLFFDRYQLWVEHDLANYRPPFYKNLRVEEQITVWRFIEQHYLSKYERLFRVEFDWSAGGLWGIPFPGSVSLSGCYGPEDLNLPDSLAVQLTRWHKSIDNNFDPWSNSAGAFDWEASDKEGLAIAKRIKAHIGPDIYLEFNPYRELVKLGNEIIEMPVPDFAALFKEDAR